MTVGAWILSGSFQERRIGGVGGGGGGFIHFLHKVLGEEIRTIETFFAKSSIDKLLPTTLMLTIELRLTAKKKSTTNNHYQNKTSPF